MNVPGRGAGRVVLAQAHDDEPGQVAVLLELAELLEEDVDVVGVAAAPCRALEMPKSGHMWPTRPGHAPLDPDRAVGLADAPAVLAVAAVGQAARAQASQR